ncbi:MAG TPA: hypothetical protein VLR49_10240, partial [Ferruginibacter sp.]|nr:hypothetical protein [Ferruginibacter sp.]
MTANPNLNQDFTITCPCCAWHPPQQEFKCTCGQHFEPFLNNVTCSACSKGLEIYCDPASHGCGHTACVEEWVEQLPAIVQTMVDEVALLTAEEYKARKNLETYFEYCDGHFISQIPFETAPFTMGISDCVLPFSEYSTKELIDLFNTQAGIESLTKTECRRIFLLLQELVSRGINFNFFKSHD